MPEISDIPFWQLCMLILLLFIALAAVVTLCLLLARQNRAARDWRAVSEQLERTVGDAQDALTRQGLEQREELLRALSQQGDNQLRLVSGMSQAQVTDPLSGRQTSVSGAFLGRLAIYVFMFSGGLTLWVGVLMESFALWPLGQPGLTLKLQGVTLFESAFAQFAGLTFLMAAPALVVLYAIDLSLGLMNRYAPQLNLISISMSLKGVAAVGVWLVMLGTLVRTLLERLADLTPTILQQVNAVLG